jgi:DNA-directed RNA polymerase subunit RPC12/RpoP
VSTKPKCGEKHTKYQPTSAEFRCPKCGATPKDKDSFVVEESPNFECDLTHDDDLNHCFACGYSVSGRQFAAKVARDKGLVRCEHCKGSGLVKAEST